MIFKRRSKSRRIERMKCRITELESIICPNGSHDFTVIDKIPICIGGIMADGYYYKRVLECDKCKTIRRDQNYTDNWFKFDGSIGKPFKYKAKDGVCLK